jgi:hypothetical protein
MTKLLVVLVVAVALLAFGGSALLERVSEARTSLPDLLERGHEYQSAAQISAAEFLRLPKGSPQSAVEASLGEPDRRHRVSIERLELDCWYYGIAGATGAYQLCFVDGKLRSKVGFGAERSV